MPTIRPTLRDLAKGLDLSTNAVHKVIIQRLFVDAVEMEDVHFHHNSAVVLPWRYAENTGTMADEQRIAGLSVIVAALKHAKANPAKQVMLAGHADSSGGADYNRRLSSVRAEATEALLKGDRDGWGSLVATHDKVEDLQLVLAWVAEVHGWTCHPGAIDDDLGPKTRAARRAFRRRHNRDFGGSLSLDAATSAADWKAVFDLYELGLHDELGADLVAARSALKFRNPAILACGEDFATGAFRPAGMRSASDRRVDILFLEPGQPYPDFHSETPPGRSIYGPVPFVPRTYLPVDPPVQLALRLTAVEGLYKPGHVAAGDVSPKLSGYCEGYLSEDDLGRIFVNHKPRVDPTQSWDDVAAKDLQYIELCAEVTAVTGAVPPDARVEWEWFDPNDPAHPETNAHAARLPDEVDVDGHARSPLNIGKCDFPRPSSADMARFGQADGMGFADGPSIHICDTEIKGGKSRVRLHVSSVAGDNFVVTARLKNSPRITPSGQVRTGVMTVWKRIDVEYVRMADAFALPVARVPPLFEPARVQMDFAPERTVPNGRHSPFLTTLDADEDRACAEYARSRGGQFTSEGKPGWFFLAAVQRASREHHVAPSGGGAGAGAGPRFVYEGSAKVEVVSGRDQRWEKLVVDQVITGRVAFLTVRDVAGGPRGFMGVWRKDVIGGKTHLHLEGNDYQSDFVIPRGRDSGRMGDAGRGGAYDKTDVYYLRHRFRKPSRAFEAGGMGFREEVFIQAEAPGATETTGLSPSAVSAGEEYFAGRLVIFTRAFGAPSLDEDEAVATIVHEFTHSFGYPHKCGYFGWPQPPSFSCSMNYFSTWLYDIGTRNLHRFEFGTDGPHLCSKHLAGVREVHLEENPAIWRW